MIEEALVGAVLKIQAAETEDQKDADSTAPTAFKIVDVEFGDDSVLAAINANNRARIAQEKQKEQRTGKKKGRRIGRIALLALCAAGCVASAVACICNGLWYAAISPIALVAVSAFNIKQ